MSHYSEHTHPFYNANRHKWKYAQQVYDCTAYDYMQGSGNAKKFVPQKVQREPDIAYDERLKLLDPQMHFPTGIDSLNGFMISEEEAEDRMWFDPDKTQGLGDPSEPGTIAYKLTRDADGKGTNWEFIPKQVGIKLSLKKTIWGLVDGRPKDGDGNSVGEASVKIIDPESVVNWYHNEAGQLSWVLVKEKRDIRTSYKDDPEMRDCFVEYTLEGWRRFYVDEEEEIELGKGTYTFYATRDRNKRVLPIFRVDIPLPRNPGYTWARKSNAIQNFESRLDFAHMSITFALLQVAESSENWNEFVTKFKKGMSAIRIDPESSRDHSFLQQDSSYFDASEARLAKKIKDFYKNMFKDYGDAAAQRTATEMRLESKSGIEAYLSLLVGAIDEFENNALFRISQVYFPDTPDVWGDARVSRKADFSPSDVQAEIDRLTNRYMPNGKVPVPVEALTQIIRRILSADSVDLGNVDDDEIEALAQQEINQQAQESQLANGLGIT